MNIIQGSDSLEESIFRPSWTLLSLISQSSFQALAEVPVDVAPGRSEWLRSSMGMTWDDLSDGHLFEAFFPRGNEDSEVNCYYYLTVIGQL